MMRLMRIPGTKESAAWKKRTTRSVKLSVANTYGLKNAFSLRCGNSRNQNIRIRILNNSMVFN